MKRTVDTEHLIKPAKFAHFVLRVSDLEASIQWYAAVLGMEMVHRAEKLAFMTYDEEHHRLALVETPVEAATPGAPGLDHVAYTLSSLGDLMATYKRLKTKDIMPVWPINHGLTTSLYYADPDGNRVSPEAMGMPGGHPEVTEVTVELTDLGDRTRMVMTHAGIPADSPGAMGWNMALDKLEAHLAG